MDHPLCALCGRPVPPHARQSRHHLIPKLKGGKGGPTVLLHQICHSCLGVFFHFTVLFLFLDFYELFSLLFLLI